MTTVQGTCSSCDDVEIAITQLSVRVCLDDDRCSYAFPCPGCSRTITNPLEPEVVDVLLAAGAVLQVWSLPAELAERHDGPPISHDDVLDFHLALQGPDWLGALQQKVA